MLLQEKGKPDLEDKINLPDPLDSVGMKVVFSTNGNTALQRHLEILQVM